jgi:RNA-directed DNA polymerase
MESEQNVDQEILHRWMGMETKEDFLGLLNYAGRLVYGPSFQSFELKQITYYANPQWAKTRYSSFTIRKKSGKERLIHSPEKGLKYILGCLNFIFQKVFPVHHRAYGFIPRKSIADNAALHVGKPYVYNIDLSDFFHSFDIQQVKMGLMFSENGLGKEREPLAFFLAALTTHPFEIDGKEKIVLPQGAPTSPALTNILCFKLDRRLHGLAKRFNLTYSRYADDITFSGGTQDYLIDDFQDELNRLIHQEGLRINPRKTRSQARYFRQEVTGLTVNEKVNVSRQFQKKVSSYLYLWKRYGYETAAKHYESDLAFEAPTKEATADLVRVLEGKLNFIRMVKGVEDSTYRMLRERFEKLRKTDPPETNSRYDLETVVDTILQVGFERGLELLEEMDKK